MKLLFSIVCATILTSCASTQHAPSPKKLAKNFTYEDISRPEGATDNPADKNAQPLVRIPPIMPRNIDKSGHCMMKYDVTPLGRPTLVKAVSCSDRKFAEPAINTVKHWLYTPKIVNGEKVRKYGVETKISFQLMDERGNLIPE